MTLTSPPPVAEANPSSSASPPRGPSPLRFLARAVATLLGVLLVLVFVAAVFLAVATRTSGNGVPTVLGYRPFMVLSGSMTPTFDAGDLIVDRAVTKAQAAHLQVGEVITFEAGPGPFQPGTVITHRIYRVFNGVVSGTAKSTVAYQTKGDANPAPDGDRILPSQILGVYQFRVPDAGYVLNALHQPGVFIALLSLPFVVLVVAEARRRWSAAPGQGGEK